MNTENPNKSARAKEEEKILAFWQDKKIFEKSVNRTENPKGEYVFYEGPPTANGKPGIHHLEARAFKDLIPRYKTMQGYHVRRKGGWDTHGLPVELQVEKELGLTSKKEVENFGVAKFNQKCKESVWQYLDIWNQFTHRIGYWVDQEHPYVTYHNSYIESLWSVVSEVHKKGLIYKDYKVLPWCPRCGTALSSHELAQGYQDDKDLSVYAKFKVLGQENTYILAWTTTPWTLPGNVALAVGADIEYVKIKSQEEYYILAKERLSILGDLAYDTVETILGSDLVGLEYEPLYPYLKNELEKKGESVEKAFKVYPADFVTTTDGTGVVHTAVMYGQDDFELGTQIGLPKYHTVNLDGTFKSDMDFLSGRFVKDEEVAIDIIKDLAHRGLLFKKEKYEHSYPHCWRCKTPLIYYARDSWYIRMSELRDQLVEENKSINWEPNYIRDGRFGEWLKDIKDWAISRERYWGTPLPIWEKENGERVVIGSIDDIKKYTKRSGNSYFVMRHGGTEGNEKGLVSYTNQATDHLTEKGKQQVRSEAGHYQGKIDLVIASPFTRTRETAEIVIDELGLPKESLVFDERLIEINPGEFDGKSWDEYHQHVYDVGGNWYERKIKDGESLQDVGARIGSFLYEIELKYAGKKILIVTHGGPAWVAHVVSGLYTPENEDYHPADTHAFVKEFKRFQNGEIRPLDFVPLPHDETYRLDLHKPYIDDIELVDVDGNKMTRTKEVMDVWFDSGCMPFAQDHYPFENKEVSYPADFICEAIDQTRGWFYTLHAVGTLLGRGKAYKNVICLGHILDAQGKKMSKSLGNIVDPWVMMEKYGVDPLRFFMYTVNQPGESKNFDEKTVLDIERKVFNLLENVTTFYELYRDTNLENNEIPNSQNVLDIWILAKLSVLIADMTEHLDSYKLLEPGRAMREFIDDLSTWYVRRSRERLKEGDTEAKQTLYFVLKTVSKLMAPFTPFTAEALYQKLRLESDPESVHLESWPELKSVEPELLNDMQIVRNFCTSGNALRGKENIPVRQPLSLMKIAYDGLTQDLLDLIKDELNIKEILIDMEIQGAGWLDTTITPELKAEGNAREFIRAVQDMRKQKGLEPSDVIALIVDTDEQGKSVLETHAEEIKKVTGATEITFAENQGQTVVIDGIQFVVGF